MEVVNVENIPGCFNVAIVVSRYHQDITQKLLDGALQRLQELGFHSDQITEVWVPGVTELPLTAQRLARTRNYEVILCLGSIILNETQHFDHLCKQVSHGCQQVALTHDIPVIFGVLMTDDLKQAIDQANGKKGHRGREAVDAAFEFISVLRQI
jgi:6,7-dimethyl-8-ribityllumazine synthase